MTTHLGSGRTTVLALVTTVVTGVLTLLAPVQPTQAGTQAGTQAATPLTVAQAIDQQDASTRTVRGYVVGQPTATDTVVTSGFPTDHALAIADTAGETSTGEMLYVQVPSEFRAQWGLRSNPGLMGDRIDVTGRLTAYFAHAGLKDASAFAHAGDTDPTDPPDGDSPWDDTYYAPAIGKSGDALKASLHDIIDGHTGLTYSEVWTALKDTDEDPANSAHVVELYSGRSISKSLNGGDPDDWNREHVWAKSHGDFGTATGPGTDVHHLRPTDVTVNSARGNKDFDLGGSSVHQCADCWTDSDSFEPRDAVKGDVARMMFYMAVRYEGDDGWPDLELNDRMNGTVAWHGRISVLLQWNAEDPVSALEMRRNDRIHSTWQGNRNPFVDHPEWAESIW